MAMQQRRHPMQQDAIPCYTACTIIFVPGFNVKNLPSLYKISASIKFKKYCLTLGILSKKLANLASSCMSTNYALGISFLHFLCN